MRMPLGRSERPKPGQSAKRRLFNGGELEQTIAAAGEPYNTLFTLAALTGARVSELLALRWANVSISDPEEAEVEFACQVDRQLRRDQPDFGADCVAQHRHTT